MGDKWRGRNTTSERSATVWKKAYNLTYFYCVWVRIVSRTVASAFFKPTTCGEVGGHVSWSRHCFNLSLSDVREVRADFMVVCTGEEKKRSALKGNQSVCSSEQCCSSHRRSSDGPWRHAANENATSVKFWLSLITQQAADFVLRLSFLHARRNWCPESDTVEGADQTDALMRQIKPNTHSVLHHFELAYIWRFLNEKQNREPFPGATLNPFWQKCESWCRYVINKSFALCHVESSIRNLNMHFNEWWEAN